MSNQCKKMTPLKFLLIWRREDIHGVTQPHQTINFNVAILTTFWSSYLYFRVCCTDFILMPSLSPSGALSDDMKVVKMKVNMRSVTFNL